MAILTKLHYGNADEKMHMEAFNNLVELFRTVHVDNMKILKALIYAKEDQPPLIDCSNKTRVCSNF